MIAAKTEMLIRKPAAEVFEAFVDPAITSQFWFTRGSSRLEPGKRVEWTWETYGFAVEITVLELDPHRRILIEWPASGLPTTVEWTFTERPDGTTFVTITNSGFTGSAEEIARQAIGATEGFSFVLAGLKALLEHNVRLNLVPDRFPDGLPSAG